MEFLCMADEARDPVAADELKTLYEQYMAQAAEMEAARVAPIESETSLDKAAG
jgi:hypothetical protein